MSSLVRGLIWWIRLCTRIVVWPLTTLAWFKERRSCPPVTEKLLLMPAVHLAQAIRIKQLSSTEVVQAYIRRVEEVNPLLNAVVQQRFSDALTEAREIDEFLSTNKLSEQSLREKMPLLGVPLTVKETIGVKGMSNNGAWSIVPEHIAREDAVIIRRLRDAGAIPLLVSNTPELCMNWETFNPRVGTTNNPYDTRRTPAGSSGGEAALLGSAASVIGMGSDIAGSLRLPATFSGVFGHKPTPGYVSNRGHRPSTEDEDWDKYFTVGPMCRYAEDLPLLLSTIAEPSTVHELRLHEQVDLSRVKVWYMDTDGSSNRISDPVCAEVQTAVKRAASHLHTKYGCTVQQASVKGLDDMLGYSAFLMVRMNGVPNVYQKNESDADDWNSVALTILKRMMCLSSSSGCCLMYALLKFLVDSVSEDDYGKFLRRKHKYMDKFKEMLGEDGVFIYPTFPNPAHFHGQVIYKFYSTSYMTLFNVLEMPATACPMGLNKEGLPIGIQIGAWQKQDRLSFAVARALQEEFGGWTPPGSSVSTLF